MTTVSRGLLALAVGLLPGCQCGPGSSCTSDADCGGWGTCSSVGFCVLLSSNSDGGSQDAGSPDGSPHDAGSPDGGTSDAGSSDAGSPDAGSSGSVHYSPLALDFGSVSCGSSAAPKPITFSNTGNRDYTIVPALVKGGTSPYAISMNPSSGLVAQGGGSLTLTVTPAPVPQDSDVIPNLLGDTLRVSTDVAGDSPHDIAINQTPMGAILALSTRAIDFGSVPVGASGSSQFSVGNTGNAPGTLSFTPTQPTVFALPQNLSVGGSASVVANGTFSPQATSSYSDSARITASSDTVLCRPLPFAQLGLSGRGSATNVVTLSATSLDFGQVRCGSQASPKTLSLTNGSSQALSLAYQLALGQGALYTVTGPATVSAGATVTVMVAPRPVPGTSSTAADGFADTLSIQATGGPVDENLVVALHQTAQGAILSFNPTSLSFSAILLRTDTQSFTVNNQGNLAAPYTLALGGAEPGYFSVTSTSGTVSGGGSASDSVTFSQVLPGSHQATLSISTGAALCAPLPTAIALNGSSPL